MARDYFTLTAGWDKAFGGTSSNYGKAVVVERSTGNIFVVARFSGATDFGGGTFTSLPGSYDMILAKYKRDGTNLWCWLYGSTGDENPTAIALDSSGNIYVGGTVTGTANVGGYDVVSAGGQDIFVSQYDPYGVPNWRKQFGSGGEDVLNGLAVTAGGNIVITGVFQGTGSLSFGGAPLTGSARQMYVAKLSGANGGHIWSKAYFTTSKSSQGNAVAVNSAGDAYIAGTVGTATSFDALFMRINGTTGVEMWHKQVGAGGTELGLCIAVDSLGQPYVAGQFNGAMNFGNNKIIQNNNINPCAYIAKLASSDSACQWAVAVNNSLPGSTSTPTAMAMDVRDNVLLTGTFQNSVVFDATTLICTDAQDVFITRYSTTGGTSGVGGFTWARKFGGNRSTNTVTSTGIFADSDTNIIVIGSFSGYVKLHTSAYQSHSGTDMFLCKLATFTAAVPPPGSDINT